VTRIAYILAASHSGSTLLSMLLGSHPQIATVGEMNLSARAMGNLDGYRCSCGCLIRECDFWQKIRAGMARRGLVFDLAHAGTDYRFVESPFARRLLGPLHRGRILEALRDTGLGLSAAWRRQLPERHRRNAALAALVAETARADVIVDSSKSAVRLKYLLRNRELDVKVIRLVRDGRAVALTYMDPAGFADAEDPARRGGGTGGPRTDERLSMARAAYDWRRCVEEADHLLRCLDRSRWIEVRYEDYCTDPGGVLVRLHRFLGVAPAPPPTSFRAAAQHVVGNGMRLDTTSQVVLDERWKSVLKPEELRMFDRIAGKVNRRCGYC
jgi:hypothetical protein